MRRLAAVAVALLAAAWVLPLPFPAATAADIIAAPTGGRSRKGT